MPFRGGIRDSVGSFSHLCTPWPRGLRPCWWSWAVPWESRIQAKADGLSVRAFAAIRTRRGHRRGRFGRMATFGARRGRFMGGVSRRTKLIAYGARGADNRAPSRTTKLYVHRQPRGACGVLGRGVSAWVWCRPRPWTATRREALGANPSASNVLIRLIYRRVRERPSERPTAPPHGHPREPWGLAFREGAKVDRVREVEPRVPHEFDCALLANEPPAV